MYIFIHKHIHMYTYVYTYVRIHMYTHIYIYIHKHLYLCIHVYLYHLRKQRPILLNRLLERALALHQVPPQLLLPPLPPTRTPARAPAPSSTKAQVSNAPPAVEAGDLRLASAQASLVLRGRVLG